MTYEYQYGVYNPGQYPVDAQAAWDALVAVGWQVDTAAPNYNEICILWRREIPGSVPEPSPRSAPGKAGRAGKAGETGPAGPAGPEGQAGPAGPVGPAGAAVTVALDEGKDA